MCLYNYLVDQQYFDGDAKQNITISAKIGISCHSGKIPCLLLMTLCIRVTVLFYLCVHAVGLIRGKTATQFCMTVNETDIQGSMFNESSDAEMK